MKIDRLLGIVVLLMHRKRMKAAELSRYFEVSERTVYRDIDTLNRAGIPILSLPGQDGGYELMDRFKLDKKYLTLDELLFLQWALRSIEKATEIKDISELVSKINRLIDPVHTEKHSIQLHISQTRKSLQHIQTIYNSIQNCRVIVIRYVDHHGNETERTIEPMGIFLKDSQWYTWAYCLLRNELRIFKLTRIMEIHNTNRNFARRPYTIEDVYVQGDGESGNNKRPFTVCLQFSQAAKAQVLDNFTEGEIADNPDGTMTVKRRYYTIDQAIAQIISYGNKVRIISPEELTIKFLKSLDDIKKIYED